MKIHIVTEAKTQSWVLRPLAERLALEIPKSTVGTRTDLRADANLFFNYALYKPVSTITAAFFTHRETDERRDEFDRIASEIDWCFAQSKKTALILPVHKTSIIPTFPTKKDFYKSELVLGVVGREYSSGRKLTSWLADLRTIEGVKIIVTGGKLKAEELPDFYREIDYLLVLSDNEGGPQPVLEAVAMCKPIIAPNVGYCWEFPCIKYSSKEELIRLIRKLILPRNGWELTAKHVLEKLR